MTDLEHDDASIIMNLIKDAVGPLADSVALSVGEFLAFIETGIIGKRLDSLQDPLEVLGDGFLDQKPISCHALSGL